MDLPEEITKHLPEGYQPKQGCWLVLPESDRDRDGMVTLNSWLRAQDWYPQVLQTITWFGDDGVGNLLGWNPSKSLAVLWNPEDGAAWWKEGSVAGLWEYILSGYGKTR